MKIFRTVHDFTDYCMSMREQNRSLGLVPTMGALHDGHLSLVQRARNENDVVVVSVFVNPTQFNNPTDLVTYPRTEEADVALLRKAGVDAAFIPTVDEIYPEEEKDADSHVFDLGSVAEVMEGAMRPGHFQGVAQIVSRLMRMSGATRAYFGEKDFQQIAVIRRMVATEGIDIEIVPCPIKREPDGLALSSRNTRLTPEQRAVAPGIHRALAKSVDLSGKASVQQVHDVVVDEINALPYCEVEYFDIVDGTTLQKVESWRDSTHIVGCITVYCGPVRLIDNICYRK